MGTREPSSTSSWRSLNLGLQTLQASTLRCSSQMCTSPLWLHFFLPFVLSTNIIGLFGLILPLDKSQTVNPSLQFGKFCDIEKALHLTPVPTRNDTQWTCLRYMFWSVIMWVIWPLEVGLCRRQTVNVEHVCRHVMGRKGNGQFVSQGLLLPRWRPSTSRRSRSAAVH